MRGVSSHQITVVHRLQRQQNKTSIHSSSWKFYSIPSKSISLFQVVSLKAKDTSVYIKRDSPQDNFDTLKLKHFAKPNNPVFYPNWNFSVIAGQKQNFPVK